MFDCGVRGYCGLKWVFQSQIICKFSREDVYTQEGRRKCLAADLRIITINTYIRNFSDYSNAKIQKFRYCAFYENETTLHPKDKRMKFDFINSNTRRIVSVFYYFFFIPCSIYPLWLNGFYLGVLEALRINLL